MQPNIGTWLDNHSKEDQKSSRNSYIGYIV